MRIMIFDVPAESGGALTILNQYYDEAINNQENEWIFVISTPKLIQHENVKILNYPWTKKSWFHRLYFDTCVASKLVDLHNVDEVISLQNVIVPNVDVKQTLYVHQPLPFVEKRYSLGENLKFWVYQNIISRKIFKSIQSADSVIVQTKWMMNAILNKVNVDESKFLIQQPKLNIQVKKIYKRYEGDNQLFFYPSSGMIYKNHEVIVNASKLLMSQGINNFKIVFTLRGDENAHIIKLREYVIAEKLPIEFIGPIDINLVYDFYSRSTLIFASYIETFGLPMLEAKMHMSPVIATDCPFSHEILDGYERVSYFDPFSSHNLAKLIEKSL